MKQIDRCVTYFKQFILDELPANCWIAGGAIRDFFSLGYCSSDIDVFFPSMEEFIKADDWLKGRENVKCTFRNEMVVNYKYKKHKVQLIKTHFFSSPQETIANFDFTVACGAVDKEMLYAHDTFFIDLAGRRIVINSLPFPLSTLQRLQRYIKKGYTICNGGLLEIAKGIQKLDLNNPTVNTFEFYPEGAKKGLPRFVRID